MSVVDREFPQPGSADQFMGALKEHIKSAAATLKVAVRVCPWIHSLTHTQIHALRTAAESPTRVSS